MVFSLVAVGAARPPRKVDVTYIAGLAELASFEFFVDVECVKVGDNLDLLRRGLPTTTEDYDEAVSTND